MGLGTDVGGSVYMGKALARVIFGAFLSPALTLNYAKSISIAPSIAPLLQGKQFIYMHKVKF